MSTNTVVKRIGGGVATAALFSTLGVLWTISANLWTGDALVASYAQPLLWIALPAFVAGAVFFPVDRERLTRRLRFTGRAARAAAAGALVHRLLFVGAREQSWCPGWDVGCAVRTSGAALANLALHPLASAAALLPDATDLSFSSLFTAQVLAVVAAMVLAFLAQPLLARAARGLL